MHLQTINSIKFTPTELKILACLSNGSCKPREIAIILDKSPKTVYSQIDKIKHKINCHVVEDISLFIRKAEQFADLKRYYRQIYMQFVLSKESRKIKSALQGQNVICNVVGGNKNVIGNILDATGISMRQVEDFQSIGWQDDSSLCLFFANSYSNIVEVAKQSQQTFEKSLFFLPQSSKEDIDKLTGNVIRLDKENYENQVHFELLKYLTTRNSIIGKLNSESKFLEQISGVSDNLFLQEKEVGNTFSKNVGKISWQNSTVKRLLFGFGMIIIIGFVAGFILPASTSLLSKKSSFTDEVFVAGLPPRDNNFTGREDLIKQMADHFSHQQISMQPLVVAGPGGIGKTALISEYAYRNLEEKKYQLVFWINAESFNHMRNSYYDIADRLAINTLGVRTRNLIKVIHKKLSEKYTNMLLVLDNVSDSKSIQPYLQELHKKSLAGGKLHVLISSQSQHWNARLLQIDVFSTEEAEEYVRSNLSKESSEDIARLSKSLHYFPLAISQAVDYIKQHSNITNYLNLYNSQKLSYLDNLSQISDRRKQSLWKSTFITLKKIDTPAKNMLYVAAYLAPDHISMDLFDDMSVAERDLAINQLRKYSLVKLTEDRQAFQVHRLLQEMIRLSIDEDNNSINAAIRMAEKQLRLFNKDEKAEKSNAKEWLRHISNLSLYVNRDIPSLLYGYGKIAKYYGQYGLANNLYKDALAARERTSGVSSELQKAEILDGMGVVNWFLGKYQKAKELYNDAYAIKRKYKTKKNDIALAESLKYLASVAWKLGEHTETKKLYERALVIQKENFNEDKNIAMADTLRGLGQVENAVGNHHRARQLHNKELEIRQDHYKEQDHIELSSTNNNLCHTEILMGNYKQAQELCLHALKVREKHYQNEEHISFSDVLDNLGDIAKYTGDYEQAEQLYRRSLRIREKHYQDPWHIDMATSLSNIGSLQVLRGEVLLAEQSFKRSLQIKQHYFSSEKHSMLFKDYEGLGDIAIQRKDYKKASSLYKKSIDFDAINKGYADLNSVARLYKMSLALEGLGKYSEALQYLQRISKIQHEKKELKKDVADLQITPNLSWDGIKGNRDISYWQKNISLLKDMFASDSQMLARSCYFAGQSYFLLGETSLAKKHYSKAIAVGEKALARLSKSQLAVANLDKNIQMVRLQLNKT